MTNIITQILAEVLNVFGIATKELKRGLASKFRRIACVYVFAKHCVEKFLRKLAGMADLEDALKKLDRLTQEEARMANTEVLRLAHDIRNGVKIVDGRVEEVGDKVGDVGDKVGDIGDKVGDIGDKVEDIGDKVEDVGDKVGDVGNKVQCVGDKVQVVIDGARDMSGGLLCPSNIFQTASKPRRT